MSAPPLLHAMYVAVNLFAAYVASRASSVNSRVYGCSATGSAAPGVAWLGGMGVAGERS